MSSSRLKTTPGAAAKKALLPLALFALLAAGWLTASRAWRCLAPGRAARLACTVARHTGFAHMTRGMNTHTIAALDAAADAGAADVPLLQGLLADDDRIVAMTAAEVLQKRGAPGRRALKDARAAARAAHDAPRAALIGEYGGLDPADETPGKTP